MRTTPARPWSPRLAPAALALALALPLALAGCGASTVADVTGEAVADGGEAPAPVCVPVQAGLSPRSAEVMLVIDRSSSMLLDLEGQNRAPSRWTLVRDALTQALPPYQHALAMGAVLYPASSSSVGPACALPSAMDVMPLADNAGAIVSALARSGPAGRTPTWGALDLTGRFLRARATRGTTRSIVLVTDGGPNCNAALDGARCTCANLGPASATACRGDAELCVDSDRTVALVRDLARSGISTYVVGIDDASRPDFTALLNALATAGGRPNPRAGAERYYSVRRPEDLAAAFTAVQQAITRCAFVTPSAPSAPARVDVTLGGAALARDPSHQDGWDWTDAANGELTLFGAACEQAIRTRAAPVATTTCAADAPDGG